MKNKKKSDTFPPLFSWSLLDALGGVSPAKNPEKYSEAETSKRKAFFPNSSFFKGANDFGRVVPTSFLESKQKSWQDFGLMAMPAVLVLGEGSYQV